jgi:hypothetical protein
VVAGAAAQFGDTQPVHRAEDFDPRAEARYLGPVEASDERRRSVPGGLPVLGVALPRVPVDCEIVHGSFMQASTSSRWRRMTC